MSGKGFSGEPGQQGGSNRDKRNKVPQSQQGRSGNQNQYSYESQSGNHQGQQRTNSGRQKDLSYVENQKQKFKPSPRENFHSQDGGGFGRKRFSPVKLENVKHKGVIEHLQKSKQQKRKPPTVTLQHIIDKSVAFWDHFPSDSARLHILEKNGVPPAKLENFAKSVYPIVHYSTLNLMVDFLDFKMKHGSMLEKDVYGNMDLLSFVDRLLKQRPLSFLGANDQYLLSGPLKHGYGGFDEIGTPAERPPLILQNYLSYDEMRIAALISLSSWSMFVNDGRRKNYGEKDKVGTYQPDGVIVGQVGARLKKQGVMEYIDCVVLQEENIPEKGYGSNNKRHVNSVWGNLWGSNLPTYKEAMAKYQDGRDGQVSSLGMQFEYIPIGDNLLFNVTVYKMRIVITAEILLSEASARAVAAGKKAYIHVVGLGLGVWRASNKQDHLYVEAWGDALRNVTNTQHIAHIDFSYIDSWTVHGVKDGQKFPNTNITIHFSKRNLHDKVPEDCILVCNYAWDGNSLPGNEFWLGKSCSTGDSAAACSSCVAEIHNHIMNPVVGCDALRVTTVDGRALHWPEYLHEQLNGPRTAPEVMPSAAATRGGSAEEPSEGSSSHKANNWFDGSTNSQQSTEGDYSSVPLSNGSSKIQATSEIQQQPPPLPAQQQQQQQQAPVQQQQQSPVQQQQQQQQVPVHQQQQAPVQQQQQAPVQQQQQQQAPVQQQKQQQQAPVQQQQQQAPAQQPPSPGMQQPALKKSRQGESMEVCTESVEQEGSSAANVAVLEPVEPETIPHPTIVGLNIPNPKFKKPTTKKGNAGKNDGADKNAKNMAKGGGGAKGNNQGGKQNPGGGKKNKGKKR